ncbi:MAG: GNAT family N-acetyltransferase [Bacillota bacterium]|nr:GNAT family N-acetyltransferase [Bacillota bacterium]MDW7684876.1 GNAT family N-acetyltransferase [Bacillota bacterium]
MAKLEEASFPEPLGFWALLRLWLKPITTYLVIRDNRRVAAYIGFQMYGPAAHTISMCIHPAYRRQGLAKLIQQTADDVAVSRGARWFTGEVRESNIAQLKMLESLDWETIGKCPGYFGNGEDGFVVWNWLCRD